MRAYPLLNRQKSVGLGLRREIFSEIENHCKSSDKVIDFLEVAPENWIRMGGRFGDHFKWFAERCPIFAHGLSLSLGGTSEIDVGFLKEVRQFIEQFNVPYYSEHLSFCSDDGHLYDLMPMPFSKQAVSYVADRIKLVQDVVGVQLGVEHISYYTAPGQEMREIDFLNEVIEASDSGLLLDVNNVYVNSINHGYDPLKFIDNLPLDRVHYIHIAGHKQVADDLIIDTHGTSIIEPVWDLLKYTYQKGVVRPTLLERDIRFPPFQELVDEMNRIASLQEEYMGEVAFQTEKST